MRGHAALPGVNDTAKHRAFAREGAGIWAPCFSFYAIKDRFKCPRVLHRQDILPRPRPNKEAIISFSVQLRRRWRHMFRRHGHRHISEPFAKHSDPLSDEVMDELEYIKSQVKLFERNRNEGPMSQMATLQLDPKQGAMGARPESGPCVNFTNGNRRRRKARERRNGRLHAESE